MRILHLEASPGWGGQEIRILKEAEGMRERGAEVFFGVAKGGEFVAKAQEKGFVTFPLNFSKKNWPFCLVKLLSILRREKISLLNTHSSLDAWIGGIAGKIKGIPVIRTRHLSTPIRKGLNSCILYHYLADFVVTTCEEIVKTISHQSGKPLEFCRSIPTGVEPSKITFSKEEALSFRKSCGADKEDFLVGMVCFMRSWKGVDDFLKAAFLLKSEPNIKWTIIGGGHSEEYIAKAKEMDLNIHFAGHLEYPYPAIAALDVFSLLSTAHEGVSQASLQAALLEKPLITTATGGLKEVCLEGKTGFQVPCFSPEKVAEAVLKLKNNRDLCKEMGRRAKELIVEKFTFVKMLDQMEEVYEKVKK